MKISLKGFVKRQLKRLPLRVTKNQKYDYLTGKIIKQKLNPKSNCIDVGCFEGEILDLFLAQAPEGHHLGFEPIPVKYHQLVGKYNACENIKIYNVALSNEEGFTDFNYVKSNPSYSGIKKRDYDRPNEQEEQIKVKTAILDQYVPDTMTIDLIKIDVEGAEYLVLEGARKTITRSKPVIIFEHGLGASDKYGYSPSDLMDLLHSFGMQIYNLDSYLVGGKCLNADDFNRQFYEKIDYYFVAHV